HSRGLHSFPPRRSSDLGRVTMLAAPAILRRHPTHARARAPRHILGVDLIATRRACRRRLEALAASLVRELHVALITRRRRPAMRSEEHTSELQSRENLV